MGHYLPTTDSSPAADNDQRPSVAPLLNPSIQNTDGMAEVQIHNLDSVCQGRAANPFFGVGLAQLFGISVIVKTTVTVNVTTTASTLTTFWTTNTFTIAGCTPSPFPFDICSSTSG